MVSNASRYMVSGVATETRQLIKGLSGAGHAVGLVTEAEFKAGETEHFPIRGSTSADLINALKQGLVKFRADVVHVMWGGSRTIIDISPVLGGQPWVLTCHTLSPYERFLRLFHGNETLHYVTRALRYVPNILVWNWLLRSGRIPHTITHSNFVSALLSRYGYDPTKVSLIPLGFELRSGDASVSTGPPRGDKLRLLTVAALAHTKGQHDAIAALPALCERFGNVEYRMVGEVRDKTYLAYLHKLAASLGVSKCLSITPNLSEAEKLQALLSADVYVQPSHEEGFCLAYIEAAAVVPRLVGADTGAIAAISADDEGARVVPVRSPQAIASAVIDLIECPLSATLMQQRAERIGRSFSWDVYVAAHENLYRKLIAAHPSSQ